MTPDRLKRLRQHKRKWRPWRFDAEKLTLSLKLTLEDVKIGNRRPDDYGLNLVADLSAFTSSAEVLDCITDFARGPWVYKAPEIIGKLVIALNDLLRLQDNYCADGVETFSENPAGYETPRDVVRATLRCWKFADEPWLIGEDDE